MKLSMIPLALLVGALALVSAPVANAGDCGGGHHAKAAASSKDIVDTAIGAGSFNTLVKAVQAAGLVDTLKGEGPFTVFAPTDAAFAALPAATLNGLLADKAALAQVLTYHVVAGRVPASAAMSLDWAPMVQGQSARVETRDGSVYIDGAKVIKADIETSNGIIHVIDTVILPRKDIVDTAVAAGSFNTLVTAVKAADLVDTLKGKGPFTVFAPADAAFAKLPEGTIPSLLANKSQLQAVLTYHVIPGRVLSTDLKPGTSMDVATANGANLSIKVDRQGNVTVNGAKVVSADILAGNGVIHVIDSVVLPPQS
jgi:uncharacterized surface protein with fasciclin (FAS1) repeats